MWRAKSRTSSTSTWPRSSSSCARPLMANSGWRNSWFSLAAKRPNSASRPAAASSSRSRRLSSCRAARRSAPGDSARLALRGRALLLRHGGTSAPLRSSALIDRSTGWWARAPAAGRRRSSGSLAARASTGRPRRPPRPRWGWGRRGSATDAMKRPASSGASGAPLTRTCDPGRDVARDREPLLVALPAWPGHGEQDRPPGFSRDRWAARPGSTRVWAPRGDVDRAPGRLAPGPSPRWPRPPRGPFVGGHHEARRQAAGVRGPRVRGGDGQVVARPAHVGQHLAAPQIEAGAGVRDAVQPDLHAIPQLDLAGPGELEQGAPHAGADDVILGEDVAGLIGPSHRPAAPRPARSPRRPGSSGSPPPGRTATRHRGRGGRAPLDRVWWLGAPGASTAGRRAQPQHQDDAAAGTSARSAPERLARRAAAAGSGGGSGRRECQSLMTGAPLLNRAGKVIQNVVPRPTSLSTRIVPPCSSMVLWTSDRPNPTPLQSSFVVKNGSKIRARSWASIPRPVSVTATRTRAASGTRVDCQRSPTRMAPFARSGRAG